MTNKYLILSIDELTDLYRNKFLSVHGYGITFVPSPITREWLIDQLFALDWYRRYETSTKDKEKVEVKRKVVKRSNPFKEE